MKVREIESLPSIDYSNYAIEEMRLFDADKIVGQTLKMWALEDERGTFAIVGVLRQSFLGPAWCWCLISREVDRRRLRAMRKAWPAIFEHFPVLHAVVFSHVPTGRRFAEWFGFKLVGETDEAAMYEVRG